MLHLRAIEPEDLEFIYSIENDTDLWPLSSTTVPYSHHLLEEYILNSTGDIYTDQQLRLIIEADHRPVGIIDLSSFNVKHLRAEVGIVIAEQYRHQGYGHEALILLEQLITASIHIHQLYAIIPADNEESLLLFRHAGYTNGLLLTDWLSTSEGFRPALLLQKLL